MPEREQRSHGGRVRAVLRRPGAATGRRVPGLHRLSSISAFADAVGVFVDHLADVELWPLAIAVAFYVPRTCSCARAPGGGSCGPPTRGDVLPLALVRRRLPGRASASTRSRRPAAATSSRSTSSRIAAARARRTPTIVATLLVETLFDSFIGLCLIGLRVLPGRAPARARPAVAAGLRVVVARSRTRADAGDRRASSCSSALLPAAARDPGRRADFCGARAPGLHDPAHAAAVPPRVVVLQALGWCCRVGLGLYFLEAFGIDGVRCATRCSCWSSARLATLLPFTPGRRRHAAGADRGRARRRGLARPACSRSRSAMQVGRGGRRTSSVGFIALALMLRTSRPQRALGDARAHDAARPRASAPSMPRTRAGAAPPGAEARRAAVRRVAHGRLGVDARARAASRSAVRPTGHDRERLDARAMSSRSTSPPARRSASVGVRFESGVPGLCGCAGTTFQSSARSSSPRSSSSPCTIVPDCSAQPSGRRLRGGRAGPSACSVRSAVKAMPLKRPPA